jgi:CBS domain-containing protein
VKDIKLDEVMIKEVVTISPDEKVTTAAMTMSKKNIGSILVVDNEDPIGILTEKDLLHKVVALGKDSNKLFVRDIMTSSLVTVEPDTTIFEAHKIMNENKFRRLPVVNGNKLLGIVTETDLSKIMRDYGTSISPTFEKVSSEKVKGMAHSFEMEDGSSYVMIEEKQDKVYDAFVSKISEGYAGLGILRISPEKIKEKYGLKKTLMIWLTEITGENCIKPNELEKLLFTITSFINNAERSIIMFDGIEFIESYTSFEEVFHLIQSLVDRISISNSIMVISMDKESFDNKEFHLLERGFKLLSQNEEK